MKSKTVDVQPKLCYVPFQVKCPCGSTGILWAEGTEDNTMVPSLQHQESILHPCTYVLSYPHVLEYSWLLFVFFSIFSISQLQIMEITFWSALLTWSGNYKLF